MRRGGAPGLAGTLLALLVGVAHAVPAGADLVPADDGWYRWTVSAGADGVRACCRHVPSGGTALVGCNLGEGTRGQRPGGDCETTSELLAVYVNVLDGAPREIHSFGAACPVDTGTPVNDLGEVPAADSLRWLAARLGDEGPLLDGALVAIALHEDDAAVGALLAISEDASRPQAARTRALFWLVQSDSDTAWAWLDRLLEP